ncbi:MAG: molybdopterin-dependent oxidoreductase [Acetobacteraceae bacterium]
MDDAVRTTCPYCGVGCGILAHPRPDGSVEIRGDGEHPANFGRLCSKGSALGETLSLEGRLLRPMICGEHAGWDQALDLVAHRFAGAIAEHGPDSVAFYVSGQCLTEDYYVANKLMKGYIGSANIDTNSRLCMASSVAGHKRAFGTDTVPGLYADFEQADVVVLVGSNLAWCHPVLYQRLMSARSARGTRIVVIDPRASASTEDADLHLPLRPGSDTALFNALLAHLARSDRLDHAYIGAHTTGFHAALDAAQDVDAATETGLPQGLIDAFLHLFAAHERVVTVYSQGVNQSSAGTDKVNAIINCHLATGRIGRPGMGPFSVTGQQNAMGGREVGGLANMLAAHMDLADPNHRRIVQDFWQSPRIAGKPGLKALELFEAVADGHIKALWIMATNPAVSLSQADVVRAAIAACPFVVVSDVVRDTDTTALAHVLLPAAAWGEKDGTVTNSERRISRQRAFLPLPGDARPDWWQICQVASRMGFAEAFAYDGPASIFAEHAALSGYGNHGGRDFDISGLAGLDAAAFDTLPPTPWPVPAGSSATETRFFASGGFFTADRRARFVPTPVRAAASDVSTDYPLLLNTGRIRDQWHTMTRTAKSPRLMAHVAEPFVEIHPHDAAAHGLRPADLCEVRSPYGSALLRVRVTDRQRPGRLFAPMHWSAQFASHARIGALIGPHRDPISGQPELKLTPVRLRRADLAWHGFAVMTHRPDDITADYWALSPARSGYRLECAGSEHPADWTAQARAWLGAQSAEMLAYHDVARQVYRFAAFVEGRFLGALFIAAEPVPVARTWLVGLLAAPTMDPRARLAVLAGKPAQGVADPGPTVCACFEVGRNRIAAAIAAGHTTVAAVGANTSAGTNCGSCRPDIAQMIETLTPARTG